MRLLSPVLAFAALLAVPSPVSGAAINPKDKGEPLFPEGHPNITYLTDKNWDEHLAKTDKPWIIDFYHPFCPHCNHFAPAYFELAAYYKEQGNLYVGGLSCMDHVKCRRVGITGFPTLMALNFDKKNPQKENRRIIGTHTVQEVKDYVNSLFAEAAFNETGSWPPGYTPPERESDKSTTGATKVEDMKEEEHTKEVKEEKVEKEEKEEKEPVKATETSKPTLWEESTLPMNATTRLQDAASAFVFGLKQGVFMASDVMNDEEFDALKSWLKMVSQTFPGAINRKVIRPLYEKVKEKELLDFDTWDVIVKEWQAGSVAAFKAEEARYDFTGLELPEWQTLSDLFLGQGATYRACALYSCGQWTMFHMLTLNPPETGARSAEVMVSVVASIRRFMKHFFGCVGCRDHFMEENTVETVKEIQDAEDKPLALRRWMWGQHNSVNKRLHHPIWPKAEVCPTCGSEGAWDVVEVDKWLASTFSYSDVVAPLVQTPVTVPMSTAAALRREDKETEAPEEEAKEAKDKEPKAAEPKGGDEYHPKDAELGIKNAANTMDLVSDTKTGPKGKDGLQGVSAPPVTLFAWYILPVAAVGGYLLFVRSRAAKKAYRQLPRK